MWLLATILDRTGPYVPQPIFFPFPFYLFVKERSFTLQMLIA